MAFCAGCAAARLSCPSMTVGMLRTVLVVAHSDQPSLTYAQLAALTGLPYDAIIYQVAQLSSGRGGQPGLGLLRFDEPSSRGKGQVALSEAGEALARGFLISPFQSGPSHLNELIAAASNATSVAAEALASHSLGTFCVLLQIALLQREFAFEGLAARAIGSKLSINNLPRHIAILADGLHGRPGLGLVRQVTHSGNARKKLPELTDAGHHLVSAIAAAAVCETRPVLKRPKAERILPLSAPADVWELTDEDFDDLEFLPIPPKGDASEGEGHLNA